MFVYKHAPYYSLYSISDIQDTIFQNYLKWFIRNYYSTLNSKGKFVKRGIKSRTQNLIEKKKTSVALKNRVNSEINVHEEIENFKIPFVHGLVIIDLEHLSKVRTCFVDDTFVFIYFFSFFENSHVTSSPSLSNDKPNHFMCVPSCKR